MKYKELLIETASKMVKKGKGILAADESNPTCGKRFESIGVDSTFENRNEYRDMLMGADEIENYISGVIMFDETFRQSTTCDDKIKFPEYLSSKGIVPGIKVDKGAKDLAGFQNEKITEGLDGLRERLKNYALLGAKFCKWRAVITINEGIPSEACILSNAHALARYASLCQENNLVPIVEPEVLINGEHSIEVCDTVTRATLKCLFEQLDLFNIYYEGIILKPSMVISGDKNKKRADVNTVAEMTINCLKEMCPQKLGGIAFLSGGQTDEESTSHLNKMNKDNSDLPWRVTFSYARAIQQSALNIWVGKDSNIKEAQLMLSGRAKLCSAASVGEL